MEQTPCCRTEVTHLCIIQDAMPRVFGVRPSTTCTALGSRPPVLPLYVPLTHSPKNLHLPILAQSFLISMPIVFCCRHALRRHILYCKLFKAPYIGCSGGRNTSAACAEAVVFCCKNIQYKKRRRKTNHIVLHNIPLR